MHNSVWNKSGENGLVFKDLLYGNILSKCIPWRWFKTVQFKFILHCPLKGGGAEGQSNLW